MATEETIAGSAQSFSIWIPAISALAGAFIGSLGGVIAQLLQRTAERRRERLRLAVQLAIADHDSNIKRAEAWAERGKQVRVMPVALHVDFHSRFLKLVESGDSSADSVNEIYEQHRAVKRIIDTMAPSTFQRGQMMGRTMTEVLSVVTKPRCYRSPPKGAADGHDKLGRYIEVVSVTWES